MCTSAAAGKEEFLLISDGQSLGSLLANITASVRDPEYRAGRLSSSDQQYCPIFFHRDSHWGACVCVCVFEMQGCMVLTFP